MADDVASIGIEVDSRDVEAAIRTLKRFEQQGKRSGRGVQDSNKKTSQSFKILTKDISFLKTAISGLGLGLLAREIVNAGAELEKYQNSLLAATGSTEGAADALAFAAAESERLGININTTTGSFTKLAAAAKGTSLEGQQTKEIFTSVAEAARVMGLSSEQAEGALLAISQIISKGNVQAEELRGQLGERIPGAFQIAARAMNVTTQELNKMLDNGELLAEDLLPKLAVELRATVAKGLPDAVNSAQAAFGRFSNSVIDLERAISKDLLPSVVKFVNFLSEDVIPTVKFVLETIDLLERDASKLDFGQVTLEITENKKEIDSLIEALSKLPEEVRKGLPMQKALEELLHRQNELYRIQDKFLKELGFELNTFTGFTQVATQAQNQFLASQTASGERTKEYMALLEDQVEDYDELILKLKEKIETEKDDSEVTKIKFRIQRGDLKLISDAQKEYALELAATVDAIKEEKEWQEQLADAIEKSAEAQKKATEAFSQFNSELSLENRLLQARLDDNKGLIRDLEREQMIREAIAALSSAMGRRILPEEAERVGELVNENKKLTDEWEKQEKIREEQQRELERAAEREAELLQRPFINAIEGIQNSFTDFFEQVFKGGIDSFSDLADGIKDIFIRMVAEIASLQLVRALVGGTFTGSLLGFAPATAAAAAGATGVNAGGGVGAAATGFNPLGLLGGISNAFLLGSPGLATFGFQAGQSLGLGVGGSVTLANALGFAPSGLIGALGANLLGLGGGLGGTFGGIAGTLAGGAIGGSGLGAALGAFGGPLGALAGGFIGTALGGLFGNNQPSNKAQGVILRPGAEGAIGTQQFGFTGKKFSQELRTAVDSVGAEVIKFIDAVREITGAELRQTIQLELGQRDPSRITIGGRTTRTAVGDPQALFNETIRRLVNQGGFGGGDQQLLDVLQTSFRQNRNDLEKVFEDLTFAKQFLQIGDEIPTALDEILNKFNELKETAERLKLPLGALNEALVSDLGDLENVLLGQLRGIAQQAEQLFGVGGLREFQASLQQQSLQQMAPIEQLSALQDQLEITRQAALGGDLAAIQQFPELAQQVLSVGRDVFASGAGFQELFRSVNIQLNELLSQQEESLANFTGNLDLAVRETSQDQIAALQTGFNTLAELLEEVRDELAVRRAA